MPQYVRAFGKTPVNALLPVRKNTTVFLRKKGGTMDWDAELYDRQHGFVGAYGNDLVDLVRAIAREREDGGGRALRILDVGCGTGAHLDALGEIGDAVGVDASPAMVARARDAHPRADVRVADACALPFEGAFDVAFSNAVFHWIPDQDALLASVARALADGGVLVAEMGGAGNNACMRAGIAAALEKRGRAFAEPFCFPRDEEQGERLAAAGFDVVSLRSFDRPTPLAGGAAGLRLFAEQFYAGSLEGLEAVERAAVLDEYEAACRDELWDAAERRWTADYRRLRFVARKRPA